MAKIDVGAPRRAGADDRGQMILVTGIILAVLFVALALLVNAAIYTDNVATRGGDSAGEVLEYQNGIVDSTAGLLAAENANEDHSMASEIETAVESGVEEINSAHTEMHFRRGAGTNTAIDTVDEGLFINESDVSGFTDWQIDADSARDFDMILDTGGMDEGNETSFYITLGTEQLEVNKTDGNLVVEGGSEDVECVVEDVENDDVEFNVSSELLGGDRCEFGWSAFNGGTIGIQGGENGAGTYALTVKTNEDPGEPPDSKEIIYTIDLTVHVTTPELRYERSMTVAPEGHDV